MAKKIAAVKNEEVIEELTALNHSAFSIIYNGNKKYSVVQINFDFTSKYTASPKVIASNLDIYEAHHEFKKATIDAGLFEIGIDKQ
jgi:hypothetical protein